MPKCQPCLGKALKDAIRKGVGNLAVLEKIPDCPDEQDIQFCGRVKRQASPRMQFMGECMRGGKVGMKECSERWTAQKR